MTIDQVLQENLTSEQYAAATDRASEVLCLACAGSGKSRTLAYRIARLVAEGESPEGIVAFTFTEKAAESIKRRVSEALLTSGLDSTVIGALYIGTIHAYCHRILGDMDPVYRQFDVLDENRLRLFLMSRFSDLGLRNFRKRARKGKRAREGSYFDTIKQVSNAWKTANDELLAFADVADEDADLGGLLFKIQDALWTDQYLDFSLMIRNVVDAIRMKKPGIEIAVGPLKHLMVDEYQDVNPCQEELIRLLHERSSTLFAVGDDDQAIYAWRGADVSNIIDFQQRYPNSNPHTLSQNFRSTQSVVEASDEFVSSLLGPSRIPKSPSAYVDLSPQDLGVLWFPNREAEAQWVAQRIEDLLCTEFDENGTVRGLTPADFAVLMRSTRIKEKNDLPGHSAFTEALKEKSIPFSLKTGGGPFDRPQMKVLRKSFELLRDSPIDRNTLKHTFETKILPAYPNAEFNSLAKVITNWQSQIHIPRGSTRIRLYPQELVYELLESFNVAATEFSDEVMRDIGLFSRMILDVETVYMSVDSKGRFADLLNFLRHAADYDVSTDDVVQRPDAVTVSTVHRMKGLEFPCVFVVDVESGRFPKKKSRYNGWLPSGVMTAAIDRGAYQSTLNEETRLFYTAATRAERYLYISGAQHLPKGKQVWKPSRFSQQIATHSSVNEDPAILPDGLSRTAPRRRIDDTDYPTSFSEIRYYLLCPKSYQFRERYGLNPAIPEMFGFGKTVHTSIQKLHSNHPTVPPEPAQIEQVVKDTFHLKHVPQSRDPENRPGAYENARNRAVEIARDYVAHFEADFEQERQIEVSFEIPAGNCVISGSIDLLLFEDAVGNIIRAEIIDFKTMEGGEDPTANDKLDWTELALQVQLYARAAEQVLGANAKTGSVHLLKDNQRVEVPIAQEAVDAALANVKWAVKGILASDFPMRPHPEKCQNCDFRSICPQTPQEFRESSEVPPELHLPDSREMARAFSLYKRK